MQSERVKHIDIAKGICIILIVASHVVLETDRTSYLESVIYRYWTNILSSFYVPIFFILSGIFEPSSLEFDKYKSRIGRLYKYIIAFWLWGNLTYILINQSCNIIKAANSYTPIWFLYVLLYISIIWGFLKRIKLSYQLCVVCLLAWGGYFLAQHGHSYYYLGTSMLCLPFYGLGYWLKEWLKKTVIRWNVVFISLFTWLVPTILIDRPQNISINLVERDIISFYLAAVSGSILMIELCKLIDFSYLKYVGKNSLIIMMVHFCFMYINYNILHIHIDSWWIWIVYVIVWVALSTLLIPIFRNKYYKII